MAIAETGNFTKAAEQVSRTQSAVSMQMKRLEEIVGDALFERGSRGVWLTRKGSDLLGNARRIVSLLDETAAQIGAPPLQGPVRIGIPEEYGFSVLSRALGAFAKRHPRSRSRRAMRPHPSKWRRCGPMSWIWRSSSNGRMFRRATC